MPVLTAGADTDAVRSLIDTSLTPDDLPDATILSDVFAGRASDRITDWVGRLGVQVPDNDPKLHRADIILTAAYLVRQVPFMLSERLPDYQYQRQAGPPSSRQDQANDLAGEAMRMVVDAAGGTIPFPQASTFGTAAGRRGWADQSGRTSISMIPVEMLWQTFGTGW